MTAAKKTAARAKEIQREPLADKNIPYECHVTPSIVVTDQGDYLCVLRLDGIAFECADDAVLNNKHERLNRILIGMADPHITLWQHIVRDDDDNYPVGDYPPGFAADLHAKYIAELRSQNLLSSGLYLTVVYRPLLSSVAKGWARLIQSDNEELIVAERIEAIKILDEIVDNLEAMLASYGVKRLTTYQHNASYFSEPAEFFAFLVNGRWERISLAACPLKELIASIRPLFGNETIELRGPTDTHYAAMLGIKGYPPQTSSTFLDDLLEVNCKFVATQSFHFTENAKALRQLNRTNATMSNAGDAAVSQIEELPDVADAIAAGRAVWGEHHYSVLVRGATIKLLQKNIALVRTILTDASIMSGREDNAVEDAFWGQLPGNFQHRPRLSPVTNRGASGIMSLHNYPRGKPTDNHWGDSVATFITSAGTPYDFTSHVFDVGHLLVLGQTGSGKTSLLMFLLCMMQKFGVTSINFTVRRDAELTIRALGGKFYMITTGVKTGWNPFQLDPNEPGTAPYLRQLVRKLVDGIPLTVQEERDINGAIAQVLKLNKAQRRLGRVLDYLPKGINSIFERLHKWCYQRPGDDHPDGIHAWVFDNQIDTLIDNLGTVLTTGFDLTEFLDQPELRTPINLHLFYLASRLIDGRRLVVGISEFWKAMDDPQFAKFVDDLLRTLRARNGMVVLDSQSPGDALKHEASRTLIEQTPTKILLPSPEAIKNIWMAGALELSQRQWNLVKTDMPLHDGWFLLKRGSEEAVVLQCPLRNFGPELAVLSARRNNLLLMDRLIAEHGEAPHLWLPYFYQQWSAS